MEPIIHQTPVHTFIERERSSVLMAILRPLLALPWLAAIAGIGWLLVLRFPPSGTVTFDVPFTGNSPWVDPFLPSERVSPPGVQDGGWSGQRILGDPTYSSIRTPGTYENLTVSFEFRPIRQPIIELGLMRSAEPLAFEYRPIWFEGLQDESWARVASTTYLGFVKAGTAPDVLRTSSDRVLLWRASSTEQALMDPAGTSTVTRVSLRGAHDFWAVPAGGVLAFSFAFQDANRTRGNDAVIIRVFRGEEEIRTVATGVGGSRDEGMGRVFTEDVRLENVEPGTYRVQVISDDDVFIRSVTTPSVHWVVGPRLVFGDLVGYQATSSPGIAWSDSRHLVVETFHNEGLQEVRFGNDVAKVEKTHAIYRLDRTDANAAPERLFAPNGDVRIVGDGWFAFSPGAFFAPQPRRVTDQTDLVREGITAVATSYERPQSLGDGWYRATLTFPLDPTVDRTKIALSTPGITVRAGAVDIRRLTLTYRRPPLSPDEWWRVLRREVVNAWHRLQI